jgi:hypothetical protein
MFDWFKNLFGRRRYPSEYPTWKDVPAWNKVEDDMKTVGDDMSKVIQFPELRVAPEPEPEPEKPAKIFYRLGLTDNNRVAFSLSYGEVTMNRDGVQRLIDQLEFYKSQLEDETDTNEETDE